MVKNSSFPNAIIHVDADAFFVSCEQSLHPELNGKSVIVGRDRGIATALSYEAKRKGVRRGMTMREIKRVAPETIMLDGDYETYNLFSRRMFAIMRRFTSLIEEYSIDEGFMDITTLAEADNKDKYCAIARELKATLERELGITVSVGLAPNKVLAKLVSGWSKPDGLAWIRMEDLPEFLREFFVEKLWGVGRATAEYMRTLNIFSAYDLAQLPLSFVREHFAKPHQEIWAELHGTVVYSVITEEKTSFASISKTATFNRTVKKDLVVAELIKNIENACDKARHYGLVARRVGIFLKQQSFDIKALETCLIEATNCPKNIIAAIQPLFDSLYASGVEYRATGVVLSELTDELSMQRSLFTSRAAQEREEKIYKTVDDLNNKFGQSVIHLASSLKARYRDRGVGAPLPLLNLALR